ncbi:spore coat protein GerQ [Neobacillus niacini]|uniref:spore coat protein GerQ n=1 Tax=Neobacillus niacini TaxID=86668 RepID=UPI0005EF56A6|nr:spore coat protein GerQ [Neobacillus niacini]
MNQYYNQQGYQPYPARQGAATPYQGQGFFPGGQQPGFPQQGAPAGTPAASQQQAMLPIEQSYIENILRLNKGKLATVYATFEGNNQWNAKKFVGIIEAAGRDHVILSDPQTGQRTLIPMVAFDYATFDEELEYEYPFGAGPSLGTYPPR